VRINFRRWGVFNAVGFFGFLTQIAAIAALTRGFGWPGFAATAAGLEIAALQNFVGHTRWTWSERCATDPGGWLRRYGRYQTAKTASLAANLAMTSVLIQFGLPAEIANTIAVLACAIPNYLAADWALGSGL
jgi:putative flippase GtrA